MSKPVKVVVALNRFRTLVFSHSPSAEEIEARVKSELRWNGAYEVVSEDDIEIAPAIIRFYVVQVYASESDQWLDEMRFREDEYDRACRNRDSLQEKDHLLRRVAAVQMEIK